MLTAAYEDAVQQGTFSEKGFRGMAQGMDVQVWFDVDGNTVSAYPLLESPS